MPDEVHQALDAASHPDSHGPLPPDLPSRLAGCLQAPQGREIVALGRVIAGEGCNGQGTANRGTVQFLFRRHIVLLGCYGVPHLRLVNKALRPVLIVEREILVGAKQNRVVNVTTLVAAKPTFTLPVSCVEQDRWHSRSRSFQSQFCAPLTASLLGIASKRLLAFFQPRCCVVTRRVRPAQERV